jgi:hypothetical protein
MLLLPLLLSCFYFLFLFCYSGIYNQLIFFAAIVVVVVAQTFIQFSKNLSTWNLIQESLCGRLIRVWHGRPRDLLWIARRRNQDRAEAISKKPPLGVTVQGKCKAALSHTQAGQWFYLKKVFQQTENSFPRHTCLFCFLILLFFNTHKCTHNACADEWNACACMLGTNATHPYSLPGYDRLCFRLWSASWGWRPWGGCGVVFCFSTSVTT